MATTRDTLTSARLLLEKSSFGYACVLATGISEDDADRIEVFALDVAPSEVVRVSRELNRLLFPLARDGHSFVSAACDAEDSRGMRSLLEFGVNELWSPPLTAAEESYEFSALHFWKWATADHLATPVGWNSQEAHALDILAASTFIDDAFLFHKLVQNATDEASLRRHKVAVDLDLSPSSSLLEQAQVANTTYCLAA